MAPPGNTLSDSDLRQIEATDFSDLMRREDEDARTIVVTVPPPATDPAPVAVDVVDLVADLTLAAAAAKARSCHEGLRAPRYARNGADLAANPGLFRCGSCGWILEILDGPEWRHP